MPSRDMVQVASSWSVEEAAIARSAALIVNIAAITFYGIVLGTIFTR